MDWTQEDENQDDDDGESGNDGVVLMSDCNTIREVGSARSEVKESLSTQGEVCFGTVRTTHPVLAECYQKLGDSNRTLANLQARYLTLRLPSGMTFKPTTAILLLSR